MHRQFRCGILWKSDATETWKHRNSLRKMKITYSCRSKPVCFFTAIPQMFSIMSCDVPFACLNQTQAQKLYWREIFSVKSDVKSEWNKNSPYLFSKWMFLIFLLVVNFFAFIVIGQCRWDRKQSGRKRGMGSGKILEPGFELGTPVAQQRIMSTSCPQGYDLIAILFKMSNLNFLMKWQTSLCWHIPDPSPYN